MRFTVHQPNFLPYLGFFDKVRQVDTLVFLDDVQYTRRGFTNRNRIKKPDGPMWLTVPITGKTMTAINQVEIATHIDWKKRHLSTMKHLYGKTQFYSEITPLLEDIYSKDWILLSDFNIALLKLCFEFLQISVDMKFSSSMDIEEEQGGGRIIKIGRKLGASEYFSGKSGRDYLELSKFQEEGIDVSFQEFTHPTYEQQFGEFMPNLSIIDYLFNVGPKPFW